MVGRLRRHRLVQPFGMVRGLLPADGRRPHGSHYGFWLRPGEHQGSADGRDLLRPAPPARSQAAERGLPGGFRSHATTWWTRALRARTVTKHGLNITERGSSAPPSAIVASRGPKH